MVVKLSGEALAGPANTGVDPASLSQIADEVLSVHNLGVQVAVVVGGGNYFRGRMADGWGISRAEADNIGMLGTVMNALMLRGALTARTESEVRVMTAVPIHSVAEPFIRLKAQYHLERHFIVVLAGGIGQPYVTTDYPAVQRALELDAPRCWSPSTGWTASTTPTPSTTRAPSGTTRSPTKRRWRRTSG
jgi:uridylate kinase